jgi:hypothetical protein
VPAERLAILRAAFDKAMKDPALLAEAEKIQMDISWLGGEDSHRIASSIVNADPKVIARARAIIGAQAKKK